MLIENLRGAKFIALGPLWDDPGDGRKQWVMSVVPMGPHPAGADPVLSLHPLAEFAEFFRPPKEKNDARSSNRERVDDGE